MKRKTKRTYDDDDGRTIAPMNIEGMPWYKPEAPDRPADGREPESMTKEEARMYMLAAVKAGLTIASVFGIAIYLFLLFCYKIWFA